MVFSKPYLFITLLFLMSCTICFFISCQPLCQYLLCFLCQILPRFLLNTTFTTTDCFKQCRKDLACEVEFSGAHWLCLEMPKSFFVLINTMFFGLMMVLHCSLMVSLALESSGTLPLVCGTAASNHW